jgi:phosphoribosylformimino-5-aminoimidazole carboxamide ribotide isomerase
MQLIPSIDLRGGQCVRLYQGDFNAETRYAFEPRELLRRYAAMGAGWLHVVDLDGARDGQLANRAIIAELCALDALRVQVGGGLRTRASVDDLLGLGVARVVIGSAAVEARAEVRQWLRELGAERVCLAFDVQHDDGGVPLLKTRGWREGTGLLLWDAVADYVDAGLRHVLCTDIARDGALAGPNLALYREAQRRFPLIHWQASGGVSNAADLAALAELGVSAAISGKALLEGRITTEELQPFLRDA